MRNKTSLFNVTKGSNILLKPFFSFPSKSQFLQKAAFLWEDVSSGLIYCCCCCCCHRGVRNDQWWKDDHMISHQPLSVAFMVYVMLSFIVLPLLGVVQQLVWFFFSWQGLRLSCIFYSARGGRSVPLDLEQLDQNKPLGRKKKSCSNHSRNKSSLSCRLLHNNIDWM